MAAILLWSSAVRVHDSQAYRKMDVTRERISRILELREKLLSFQTGFSFVNVAVACAILESRAVNYIMLHPHSVEFFTLCSISRTPIDHAVHYLRVFDASFCLVPHVP